MSGKFTQNVVNLMNNYFTPKINNRKLGMRIWRWFCNIAVRFNIQFLEEKKINHVRSIEHALDYISIIHVDLRNEMMEALWTI